MGRLLVLILLALVLWWLIRKLLHPKKTEETPGAGQGAKAEDMVACARCGVNLPRSEAREEAGRFFCIGNPQCLPRN